MAQLSDLMLDANLSTSSLARQANCSEEVVRKALNGQPIRAVKARAIVKALSTALGRKVTEQEAGIRTL